MWETATVIRRLAAAAVFLLCLSGCAPGTDGSAAGARAAASSASGAAATASTSPTSDKALAPAHATTSLPTVAVAALPAEARTTLRLIHSGGPFPYSKDGAVFGNREGLLPKRTSGFYREYTVVTPGSRDRGARRIVAGQNGSRFYTADHYDSFREVVAR